MDLRHYGASKYRRELFKPIENRKRWCKPLGGLWTSPIDSKYGWVDWTEEEDYGCTDEFFDLVFDGTVFVIDGVKDMLLLPWEAPEGGVLFDQMTCDAVHLTVEGERQTRYTRPYNLYGWDCETVLILNPDSITQI